MNANERRLPRHLAAIGLIALLCAGQAPAAPTLDPAQIAAERRACLICHRMETIAYRDPETGRIRDLSIDGARYARSNHGDLACTRCHESDYRQYPHRHTSADENLHCVGCHDDDPKLARLRFKEIEREFARSVHVRGRAERDGDEPKRKHRKLDCFSCHDPHVFKIAERGDDLAAIVAGQNGVCMSCHRRISEPGTEGHLWLPNREAHWRAVRCIDCHSPVSDLPSHEILPAGAGVRGCDDCHSKGSRLLNQLYSYRAQREVAEKGLLSMAVFNQSYVVGMSRNPAIDRAALGLLALTLVGIAAHALGRYLVWRARGAKGGKT